MMIKSIDKRITVPNFKSKVKVLPDMRQNKPAPRVGNKIDLMV